MLHICSEFERICRIALEKAEKEMRGNRKRRAAKDEEGKSIEQQQVEAQASYRPTITTPRNTGQSPYSGSPSIVPQDMNAQQSYPGANSMGGTSTQALNLNTSVPSTQAWANNEMRSSASFGTPSQDFSQMDFAGTNANNLNGMVGHLGMQGFGNGEFDMGGAFQQPFVPQDLWQMPMTLEWDWADVGLGGLGSVPNFGFDMGENGGNNNNNNNNHNINMGSGQ